MEGFCTFKSRRFNDAAQIPASNLPVVEVIWLGGLETNFGAKKLPKTIGSA